MEEEEAKRAGRGSGKSTVVWVLEDLSQSRGIRRGLELGRER